MQDVGNRIADHIHPLVQALIEDPDSQQRIWSEIEQLGAPLIEPDPTSKNHSLVTFITRLEPHEQQVVVQPGGFSDPTKNRLDLVPGTDVVSACYRFRNDVRLHYSFAANMPLVSWENASKSEIEQINFSFLTARYDQLNPKTIKLQSRLVSVLELKNAPDQSVIARRASTSRGSITESVFKSDALNNERKIWLYNSPGIQNTAPENLIFIMDGSWYLSLIPTQDILDNLYQDSVIGPTVAVFIDNASPTSRNVELSYNDQFAQFLTQELLPWTNDQMGVELDPSKNCLAGSSLGGLTSMWVAHTFPHLFGKVVCQSGVIAKLMHPDQPKLENNYLFKLFSAAPRANLKIWLEVGLLDDDENHVLPSRQLAELLVEQNYALQYQEFAGGHDFALWRGTFAQALRYLLARDEATPTR